MILNFCYLLLCRVICSEITIVLKHRPLLRWLAVWPEQMSVTGIYWELAGCVRGSMLNPAAVDIFASIFLWLVSMGLGFNIADVFLCHPLVLVRIVLVIVRWQTVPNFQVCHRKFVLSPHQVHWRSRWLYKSCLLYGSYVIPNILVFIISIWDVCIWNQVKIHWYVRLSLLSSVFKERTVILTVSLWAAVTQLHSPVKAFRKESLPSIWEQEDKLISLATVRSTTLPLYGEPE